MSNSWPDKAAVEAAGRVHAVWGCDALAAAVEASPVVSLAEHERIMREESDSHQLAETKRLRAIIQSLAQRLEISRAAEQTFRLSSEGRVTEIERLRHRISEYERQERDDMPIDDGSGFVTGNALIWVLTALKDAEAERDAVRAKLAKLRQELRQDVIQYIATTKE